MASVKIDIKANDSASATLNDAAKNAESFGERLKKAAAGLYVLKEGFSILKGAVEGAINVGKDLVGAYQVQETAEKSLIAALNAMGEAGEKYIGNVREIAAAIQDETAVGDEVTIQRMARAKALGVETSKLGEAAKGVIALTNVGMAEDAAVRGLALAYQGNYQMLQRYIPALREAETETEKQAALNEFLANGYEIAKSKLDTTAGAWQALQGRIGDAKEVIGQAIAESAGLQSVLTKMGDVVKNVGNAMAGWLNNGGIQKAISFVKIFAANCEESYKMAGVTLLKWYEQAKYYMSYPFIYAGDVASKYWDMTKSGFSLVVDYAKAAIAKLKGDDVSWPGIDNLAESTRRFGEAIKGNSEKYDELREKHASTMENLAQVETEIHDETKAKLDAIQQSYFKTMDAVREKQADTGEKIENAVSKTAAKAEEKAEEVTKTVTKAVQKSQADIAKLQKAFDDADAKAKAMTIKKSEDNYHAARKAEREARRQERANARYERRMRTYLERENDPRQTLSRKQQAQLDEWKKLEANKAAAAKALRDAQKAQGAANAPGGAAANLVNGGNGGNMPAQAAAGWEANLANILVHVTNMDNALADCLRFGG